MLKTKERVAKPAMRIKPLWKLTPEQEKKAERLKTEDDKPVDNSKSEKQMRLLTTPLYSSWNPGRDFMAAANTGLFYDVSKPPIIPDVFVSLDVKASVDLKKKSNRAYFFWDRGKPPEVVIEIVSNKRGGEKKRKLTTYAELGIRYYIVFDPERMLGNGVVERFVLSHHAYKPLNGNWLEGVGLGMSLWRGEFEKCTDVWLRWSDENGVVLPTADETVAREKLETAEWKAEREQVRAFLSSKGIDLTHLGIRKPGNGKH